MPTSMLDALVDEARSIKELGIEASRSAIEAVRRAGLLEQQIARMAVQEGLAAPSISADADEAEFLAFQAEHFPDVVFGAGDQNSNSPGDPPAIQIDGQGNQGSGEVAPGDATACVQAQPEQVGADAVSGEQGPACKDPETAPDRRTRKDHALDLYAESDIGLRALARKVGVSSSSIESYISSARRAADRRVAQGDLLREQEIVDLPSPAERPARAVPDGLIEPAQKPSLTQATEEQPKGDNLLALNLDKCTAAYQGQGIQLVRHEFRMLLLLNDRLPKPISAMLERCQVLSKRRLHAEISKLNARIALIGVEIHESDDDTFVARPLRAAGCARSSTRSEMANTSPSIIPTPWWWITAHR